MNLSEIKRELLDLLSHFDVWEEDERGKTEADEIVELVETSILKILDSLPVEWCGDEIDWEQQGGYNTKCEELKDIIKTLKK